MYQSSVAPSSGGSAHAIAGRPIVLALRALGLGDGLAGVPALRGLRRLAGPDAHLVLAAPAGIGSWLVGHGLADELLETPDLDDVADRWRAEHRGVRPDLAVDLHGKGPRSHRLLQSLRPRQFVAWRCPEAGHLEGPRHDDDEHEVLRWCRLVLWAGGACGPEDLRLTPDARAAPASDGFRAPAASAGVGTPRAARLVTAPSVAGPDGGPGPRGYVVVHPGAASASRCWPADRFARVVRSLVEQGERVLVTGSAAERDLTAAVVRGAARRVRGARVGDRTADAAQARSTPLPRAEDLGGRLDLPGLARTVANARLVICGDTGVAHLATAFGVASVLLFGPTPPAWWGPAIEPERHLVLWHGSELAPRGRRYVGDPHGDVVDTALARIAVEEVLAAIGEVGGPTVGGAAVGGSAVGGAAGAGPAAPGPVSRRTAAPDSGRRRDPVVTTGRG